MGVKTWFLTLREEHERKHTRIIFEIKKDED
jgi:hypothetical protein